MSGYLDITVENGATFSRTITITDDQDVAVDITNDTFRGQIRKRHTSVDIEASFAFEIVDGANGVFKMTIPSAETELMGFGRFVYDVEWVHNGITHRLLEGVADCTAEVTR